MVDFGSAAQRVNRAGTGASRSSNFNDTLKAGVNRPGTSRGNPQTTNRAASKTTQTSTPTYGPMPYLTATDAGFKYENNVTKYKPTLLPITDPESGIQVQNTLAQGFMTFASNLLSTDKNDPNPGSAVSTVGIGNDKYRFNFFYNPTEIQSSNMLATDALPPGSINADQYFSQAYPATETLTWSILLDRTQDAYYDPNSIGTLQDLYVLYGLINGGDPPEGYNLGYLYMTPINVIFGAVQNWGVLAAGNNTFQFQGYITSLNVSHQRFSQFMIPNLTAVDFTFVRVANSLQLGVTGSASSSSSGSGN